MFDLCRKRHKLDSCTCSIDSQEEGSEDGQVLDVLRLLLSVRFSCVDSDGEVCLSPVLCLALWWLGVVLKCVWKERVC